MATDVVGYLNSKGLPLKRAGGWEMHAPCPICGEDPAKRGRFYINVDPEAEIPGLYFCHRCEAKGSLVSLKRFYGDPVREDEAPSEDRHAILEAATRYYQAQLSEHPDVVSYLQGPQRRLSDKTIEKARLGYAPMDIEYDLATGVQSIRVGKQLYAHLRSLGFSTQNILATGLCREGKTEIYDSLAGMIAIPYLVAGSVVALRGRAWPFSDGDWAAWGGPRYKAPDMKYKTCFGTKSRLYNSDSAWNVEELVITEGEFDALIVEQELGYKAVAAPGAQAWQDAWDGYISPLKRVWLVFDRDEGGEKGAKKIVERFGAKVRRIHLSDEGVKCDPTQWIEDGNTVDDFEDLKRRAAGGMLVTVDDAIAEFGEIQNTPGIKFNFELLDMMLEPGLQPAQLALFLAKTGTGKTVLMLNLMHRIRMLPGQENLKILFFTLEQTRGEWWDRARRLHRFYNLESNEAEAADWWRDSISLVDANRVTHDQLRASIDDFDYVHGRLPDLVVVDYLGYYARSFKGEPYVRVSDAVMSLKEIAKETRIPILAPHQVSRSAKDGEEFGSDAARESGVVEETADFLFAVWSPDNSLMRNEEEKTGRVNMRIAKSRHGGKGMKLEMQWGPCSLVMVPQGDPMAGRARSEFNWRQQYKDNWEKAVYRHLTGFEGHLEKVPPIVEANEMEF